MPTLDQVLPVMRMAVFGAVSVFGLIAFGISAHLVALAAEFTSRTRSGFGGFEFAALGLATAILTLISVPPMFAISIKRRGAYTSYVVAELAWLSFLWIMWLATAGSIAKLFVIDTGCYGNGVCMEIQAVEAFGFLNWLMLLAYTITLLTASCIAHNKGHTSVWKSEVAYFNWSAPSVLKATQGLEGGVVGVATGEKAHPQMPQHGHQVPQQAMYPQVGSQVPMNGMAPSPQTTGGSMYVTPAMPGAPQVG